MFTKGILAMLVLSLSLVVVGCGDDDGEAASAPGSVQAAVRAIQNGAVADLASQAQFTSIGCTTADGLGGPPKCEPGQANGSMVEVLATASCEGSYLKKGEEGPSFAAFLDGDVELEGAYRNDGSDLFPAGYTLLLTFSNAQFPEQGRAVFLDEDGVTGLFFGCNHTLAQLRDSYTTGEAVWTP